MNNNQPILAQNMVQRSGVKVSYAGDNGKQPKESLGHITASVSVPLAVRLLYSDEVETAAERPWTLDQHRRVLVHSDQLAVERARLRPSRLPYIIACSRQPVLLRRLGAGHDVTSSLALAQPAQGQAAAVTDWRRRL